MRNFNKFILGLLFPLLTSCSTSSIANIKPLKANDNKDYTSINTTFYNYLKSTYKLDSTMNINFNYLGNDILVQGKITDEVSSSTHYNNYVVNLVLGEQESKFASGEFFYAKGSDNYTVEQYIDISNTIKTRDIKDTSSNKVLFEGNYNSPFFNLSKYKISDVNSFFNIAKTETGYEYSLTDKGLILFTPSFNNFFNQFTQKYLYSFDSRTHQTLLKNLKIVTDENGTPLTMSFNRIEQDFYGASVESYTSTFSKIDNVRSLETVKSSLTSEQASKLKDRLDKFNSDLSKMDFTQTITVNDYTPNTEGTELVENNYTYINYYDYNIQLMLSTLPLYDSSNGRTYIGLNRQLDSSSGEYYFIPIGISPDKGYTANLDSSTKYSALSEFLPIVNNISSDFFTYKEENNKSIYTFDISSFAYADYYYCLSILRSLFGEVDPSYKYGGFIADSNSNFNFKSLVFTLDDSNFEASLTYQNSYNKECKVTTSYSEIGNTNLKTVDDEIIKACLTVLNI